MNLAQQQAAFAAHLRNPAANDAPSDVEDRRMQIYRDLFYNNVENFIATGFPVLHKLFSDEKWHRMVRLFFANHESRTPYFPRLTEEFLGWLRDERVAEADDPAWLYELAHYEWVEGGLHISTDDEAIDLADIDRNGDLLTEIPQLSPTAWLLQYEWPVHQISPENRPAATPEQPTLLVVYRNRRHEVGFMEVNAVTARLIQLLQANLEGGATDPVLKGAQLLEQLAIEIGHPTEVILSSGLDILNGLREREILLGTQRQ